MVSLEVEYLLRSSKSTSQLQKVYYLAQRSCYTPGVREIFTTVVLFLTVFLFSTSKCSLRSVRHVMIVCAFHSADEPFGIDWMPALFCVPSRTKRLALVVHPCQAIREPLPTCYEMYVYHGNGALLPWPLCWRLDRYKFTLTEMWWWPAIQTCVSLGVTI